MSVIIIIIIIKIVMLTIWQTHQSLQLRRSFRVTGNELCRRNCTTSQSSTRNVTFLKFPEKNKRKIATPRKATSSRVTSSVEIRRRDEGYHFFIDQLWPHIDIQTHRLLDFQFPTLELS